MNQCISLHCNESGEKSIVRLKLCMVVHTQQMRFESNEYPFPTFACFFFFKSPMIQPENVAFFFLARRFDLFFFFKFKYKRRSSGKTLAHKSHFLYCLFEF